MQSLQVGGRIFISSQPTDMRKGLNGLATIVEYQWGDRPTSGYQFVFANRCQTLLKMPYWGNDGYAICYKRFKERTFRIPIGKVEGHVELTVAKLMKPK